MSRKDTQHGFALIETLLIIVILAMIGFTGWYVWHTKQATDKTLNDANKSANSQTVSGSVTTFAECEKAKGSITQQTYPEKCVTKDGNTFTDTSQANSASAAYVEVIQADESIKAVTPSDIAKTHDQQNVLAAIEATCKSPDNYVIVNYQVFDASQGLYEQDGNFAKIDSSCGAKASTVDQVEGSGMAIFLHKASGGSWVIDFQGQQGISCSAVDGKGYPSSIVSECVDGTTTRAPKS